MISLIPSECPAWGTATDNLEKRMFSFQQTAQAAEEFVCEGTRDSIEHRLLASSSSIKPSQEFESETGWVCGKGLEGRKGKGKSSNHAMI